MNTKSIQADLLPASGQVPGGFDAVSSSIAPARHGEVQLELEAITARFKDADDCLQVIRHDLSVSGEAVRAARGCDAEISSALALNVTTL